MCDCARDATQMDSVDRQAMSDAARRLVDLFGNDVFLVVLDGRSENIFDFSSSTDFGNEMKGKLSSIIESITMGENAVKQLNSGWRLDELKSFRLQSQQSRVFTFLLSDNYKFIIINKYPNRQKEFDPSFDGKLKPLIETVRKSIRTLPAANANTSSM